MEIKLNFAELQEYLKALQIHDIPKEINTLNQPVIKFDYEYRDFEWDSYDIKQIKVNGDYIGFPTYKGTLEIIKADDVEEINIRDVWDNMAIAGRIEVKTKDDYFDLNVDRSLWASFKASNWRCKDQYL